MNVLVTGGAGYIGSHAALRLLADGHAVTIVDDLSRGHRGAVSVLAAAGGDLCFAEADIADRSVVAALLAERRIDAVMHFAGLTYVGESVRRPLSYYRHNTVGTVALLGAMEVAGVHRIVFSSTCATYGEPGPEDVPIPETCPQQPINPYGRSKLAAEHVIRDLTHASAATRTPFASAILRYFNVAGSDSAGRLGEHHDPETHLIPICVDVALGVRPAITVNGSDYDTPDGTCVRDYVHVEDLVDAHIRALEALEPGRTSVHNLGLGRGVSVREVIDACRRLAGTPIREEPGPRRPGDPPVLYADPARAHADLGWRPRHDLDAMIETTLAWRKARPRGYGSEVEIESLGRITGGPSGVG